MCYICIHIYYWYYTYCSVCLHSWVLLILPQPMLKFLLRGSLKLHLIQICFFPPSEYLEVHQTELDKLMSLMKDMKRNSRLVRNCCTAIYILATVYAAFTSDGEDGRNDLHIYNMHGCRFGSEGSKNTVHFQYNNISIKLGLITLNAGLQLTCGSVLRHLIIFKRPSWIYIRAFRKIPLPSNNYNLDDLNAV